MRLVVTSQEHCKLSQEEAAPLVQMVDKMNSFHDSTSTSFCKKEWESQASSFA